MRVLLTVTGSWGTGSFQVAKGVAEGLLRRGHEVKIFFPDAGLGDNNQVARVNPVDLYEVWQFPLRGGECCLATYPLMLPDPNPRSPGAKTFKALTHAERSLYFDSLRAALKKVIDEFQPESIECQHIWAMDSVVNKLGYPFFSVAHNSDQLGFQFDPTMRELTCDSAKAAQNIFAVSHEVKEKVVEYYGVESEKVIVMPCGYDHAVFTQQNLSRAEVFNKFQLSIPLDAFVISFAGKLSRTKGIDILLRANKLLSGFPEIHFIVMGAGDLDAVLTEQEKAASSFERVHFVGHRSAQEVALLNNVSHFAVIPSRSEGFCIAGLEALACGLPLVVTEGGAAGKYAYARIVPDEDPVALANALQDMAELSADAHQHLRLAALESATHYTWDAIVAQRLNYYSNCLKR